MRLSTPTSRLLHLLLMVSALACLAASAGAQITDVSPENKAVNAAIVKAQRTLPTFFARLAQPQPGDQRFLVKIRFDTSKPNGGEHIWARDVVRNGDSVSATIDNVPRDIPNLSKDQRVTVPMAQITDWLYERDGKYHGAYTVRALVPFMSKEDGAAMRKRLAPQ